jgi:hypothetical protein
MKNKTEAVARAQPVRSHSLHSFSKVVPNYIFTYIHTFFPCPPSIPFFFPPPYTKAPFFLTTASMDGLPRPPAKPNLPIKSDILINPSPSASQTVPLLPLRHHPRRPVQHGHPRHRPGRDHHPTPGRLPDQDHRVQALKGSEGEKTRGGVVLCRHMTHANTYIHGQGKTDISVLVLHHQPTFLRRRRRGKGVWAWAMLEPASI